MPSPSCAICMLLTLLISSFSLLPSPTNASSSVLLQKACNVTFVDNWNSTQCVETLESFPKIASAKNLPTLALAIIEKGIHSGTNTLLFIKNELNSKVNMPHARILTLEQCSDGFTSFTMSFESAFKEIKNDKEYESANYDVKIAEDGVVSCAGALTSNKVIDSTISTANKFGTLFSVTAFVVTEGL